MIKHAIAGVVTVLALGTMFVVFQSDKTVDKANEVAKVIAKSEVKVHLSNTQSITQVSTTTEENIDASRESEKKKKELDDKLQALKDKAGNAAAFKVSSLYKQKCSSCHGVNGEGIIGPKLIGDSAEKIYKDLTDFKSGKKKNYVMYGLLSKMKDEQLKVLSDEIGTFAEKLKAQ